MYHCLRKPKEFLFCVIRVSENWLKNLEAETVTQEGNFILVSNLAKRSSLQKVQGILIYYILSLH